MIGWPLVVLVVAVGALRLWMRRRRRDRSADRALSWPGRSDVGLVAGREIRERYRAKIFRIGTLVILAVVAGAIVIPKIDSGHHHPQQVGVVGPLDSSLRQSIDTSARNVATTAHLVDEPDLAAAKKKLRQGDVSLVVVDGRELVVNAPVAATDTSTTAQFVRAVSKELAVAEALQAAHLSPAQASVLAQAHALPVHSLQPGRTHGAAQGTSVVGLILIFIMLNQYNGWILVGVMEEKSSRVIEVLMAAVRPIRLLTGKVLGIGFVAFSQAALVVAFALILAKAVGSDLLSGTAPLVLVSTLVWLILGYAFYCWVFAAAGSLAERQEQVQTLALPLSLPIIFGYVIALTVASSGNASSFFVVLAFLPPTAPFAMPVLVALSKVSWLGFVASAAISVVATVGMARLAGAIYRRAILHTGRRVQLRQVFRRAAG
ncbi:MAG: ABC transporter permease [Acidimicrobiales bacterium]